ncbi:GIY-YIG nuclease family protein [Sphingobacterium kyonggiense]
MNYPTDCYFVYILTNYYRTVLYVGVTNNLSIRLYQHQHSEKESKSFTKRYNVFYLIYFERHESIILAIKREKEIKGWNRSKKENLIKTLNPQWEFLNDSI